MQLGISGLRIDRGLDSADFLTDCSFAWSSRRSDTKSSGGFIRCYLYGATLLFGVLPIAAATVSWDGHLFGAMAGLGSAFALAKNGKENEEQSSA